MLTLNSAPWILTGTYSLIPNAHKLGAADHRKWNMAVHRCVHIGHRFIVRWKLIDLHTVRR